MLKNIKNNSQFEILNEYDLHCRVVKFLRKRYPKLMLIAGLGELQDTSAKRATAYNKGYRGGQPDVFLLHRTVKYSGMAIEFKHPNGSGRLFTKQKKFLLDLYDHCDYKVIVSNDYDEIFFNLFEYMD